MLVQLDSFGDRMVTHDLEYIGLALYTDTLVDGVHCLSSRLPLDRVSITKFKFLVTMPAISTNRSKLNPCCATNFGRAIEQEYRLSDPVVIFLISQHRLEERMVQILLIVFLLRILVQQIWRTSLDVVHIYVHKSLYCRWFSPNARIPRTRYQIHHHRHPVISEPR